MLIAEPGRGYVKVFSYASSCDCSVYLNGFQIQSESNKAEKIKGSVFSRVLKEEEEAGRVSSQEGP